MTVHTVIGAGVAGLAVATELVNRRQKVQIIDCAGPPGPHNCSWWAGGMLAPWCERENSELTVQQMGRESIAWWSRYTNVTQAGTLVVARTRDLPDLKRFAQRTTGFRELKQADIEQLEPDLHGFSTGLYFAEEGHLEPRQALQDLWQTLQQAGVTFHLGTPAQEFAQKSLRWSGRVFDCRGLAARDRLPGLRGVKGEMLHIRCPDIRLSRPVRLLHPRIPLYIVPRGEGIYMLGATMIENESQDHMSVRSMLELLSAAYALNPAFAAADILEIGVELRPAFADNLPRIRCEEGVIFVNGLYRHGYLLAPALARQAADLALTHSKAEMIHADID
ncbi:MAG: FAD-dependent oxidoreductase [Rhodobacteraceae bacterium]|nr:FAD-dependent oxidoreductase [Paracoccaceae bacterium]MCY4196861.1 FAD-dependent oxidoreductase [Paracoccaceae bacterium]